MKMILPIAKKIQAMLGHEKVALSEVRLHQLQSLSASDAMKYALQLIADICADSKMSAESCANALLKIDESMQKNLEQLTAKRLKVKIYNRDVGAAIDTL
ncbi:MAG: hypothetical protein Q7V02_11490, partial [Methylophilus sp.]|nr:hypothetical protein [Methylophilus sp.]